MTPLLHHPIPPGLYAACPTPLQANLTCDHAQLIQHSQQLLSRGCTGVVLFGTTGEGPLFSVQERLDALQAVVNRIDPAKIIMAIMCTSMEDAAILARAAVKYRCLGTLILPSFYFKTISDAGIIAFYREIIAQVSSDQLRILLYQIPQHSGIELSFPIISALHTAYPHIIVGMKDSGRQLSFNREMLQALPMFQVFIGNELLLVEAIKLGACGAISGLASAFPEWISALYGAGLDSSMVDPTPLIVKLAQALRGYPFPSAIKSVLEMEHGTSWLYLKPPLSTLDATQKQAIAEALKHLRFSKDWKEDCQSR